MRDRWPFYEKIQNYCSVFLLIGLVLIFVYEFLLFIQYDSILIKNKIDFIKTLSVLIILFIIVIFLRIKIKMDIVTGINILSIGLSLLILYYLRETIPYYLFIFHYESFIIQEFIVIYYSLIVFIFSVISFILNKKT